MALEAGSRPVFPDSLTSLITFSRNPIARTARYVSRNSLITQHVTNSLTSLSLYGLGDKVTTTVEMRLTPPSKMSNRTTCGTQARINSDDLFNRRPNRPTWYPLSVHQSGVGPSSSSCSVEFLADSFVPWLRKKEGGSGGGVVLSV